MVTEIAKQKVIAVVGPTASGKTSLGIFLAQNIGGEVISADSRQVYKGLDIGTGKVTKKEMGRIPHHLLDVASPKRTYTVDDFTKAGTKVLKQLAKKATTPLVVGGSGLYADILLGRMHYPNVPPNETLRKKLEKKSAADLFALLQKLDPVRAETIEPHHARRLIRAIEIAKAIGKSPTTLPPSAYEVLWLGINPSDKVLQNNIHIRLHTRLRTGMIAEAKRLHATGLSYKRMKELGLEYRYLALYLEGSMSRAEFEEMLERAIWQYAKRQRRWFARNKDIHWVKNKSEALRLAKSFLSR